jgi:AraC-like DNA-binding protein
MNWVNQECAEIGQRYERRRDLTTRAIEKKSATAAAAAQTAAQDVVIAGDQSVCLLGGIVVTFTHGSQQRPFRYEEDRSGPVDSAVYLHYVRGGSLELQHEELLLRVATGQCVLLDWKNTASLRATSGWWSLMTLGIPQTWLKAWLPTPEDGMGLVMENSQPWGAALLAILGALNYETINGSAWPGSLVAEQVAGLISLAVGPRGHRSETPQDRLTSRIRRSLAKRAHEQHLTPAAFARAHGISKRYLHALFALMGTTFGRELMSIRLTKARDMLIGDQFAELDIGEIAWRCGFTASSHFARRFNRAFGSSPRDYRKKMLNLVADR